MAVSLTRTRTDLLRAFMAANPLYVRMQLPVDLVAALVMNPNAEQVLRDHRAAILAALERARGAQG